MDGLIMIQLDNKIGNTNVYYYISNGIVYKKIDNVFTEMPGLYDIFLKYAQQPYNISPDNDVANAMVALGLGKITHNTSKVINEQVFIKPTNKNK